MLVFMQTYAYADMEYYDSLWCLGLPFGYSLRVFFEKQLQPIVTMFIWDFGLKLFYNTFQLAFQVKPIFIIASHKALIYRLS